MHDLRGQPLAQRDLHDVQTEGAGRRGQQREVGDLDPESLTTDEQESLALAIVRREMGIMAVSCGVIFFLGLRAAGTSGL